MKSNFSLLLSSLCLSASVTTGTLPAHAMDPTGITADVTLQSGWLMPNGNYMAALQVKLAPGWHTYWRAPGAAGIPPQFDWTGSSNVAQADFHWPTPGIFEQNGIRFLGYEDELILPIEFTPTTSGAITVQGEVSMGICLDVCIPYTAAFESTFEVPATPAVKSKISAALQQQPKQVSGVRCAALPIADGMKVTAEMTSPQLGPLEMAVLEHPDPNVWVSEAMTRRDGRAVTIESEMVPAQATPFFVDRSQLRITLIGSSGQAVEAQGCTGS